MLLSVPTFSTASGRTNSLHPDAFANPEAEASHAKQTQPIEQLPGTYIHIFPSGKTLFNEELLENCDYGDGFVNDKQAL